MGLYIRNPIHLYFGNITDGFLFWLSGLCECFSQRNSRFQCSNHFRSLPQVSSAEIPRHLAVSPFSKQVFNVHSMKLMSRFIFLTPGTKILAWELAGKELFLGASPRTAAKHGSLAAFLEQEMHQDGPHRLQVC